MKIRMAKRILICVIILIFMDIPMDAKAQTYTTKNEVYQVIKKNLMNRKTEFTVTLNKKTMKEIGSNTDIIQAVEALDDKATSKDADYLEFSVNKWSTSWESSSLSDSVKLSFTVKYSTTLSQEQKLDTKINSVLSSLNLKGKSDYQKVKAIHDYIIKRVSYDQTLTKRSAYQALIGKSSVCQGYSLAAYRMFTEAGLESRIISGWVDGGSHSWNIVKVNGKWYNIDLTWDDPISSTGEQILRYDYFLKNEKAFSDHIRDSKYNTEAFLQAYPVAATSYKMPKK